MKTVMAVLLAAASAAPAQAVVMSSIRQEVDGTSTLVTETVVNAPAADVWKAVSTAEGWKTWAVPVAWSPAPDELETSYAKDAKPGDATTIKQKILARVPERLMLFQTVKAPEGFPHFDTYRKVQNLLELSPEGSGRTRVRLTASGYAPTDAGRQLLRFFDQGNRETMAQLEKRFGGPDNLLPGSKLAPLDFLVGHCWRGEFAKTAEQDTHCFEAVYGGAHVRDRHEVAGKGGAVYRGESLYSWDPDRKAIGYVYWNSLGGISRGAMTSTPDSLVFENEAHTRADGTKASFTTTWRRKGEGAYEVVSSRSDSPTGESVILYRRVD